MEPFLENHSGELTILVMGALVLGVLLILVPQLLRARQRMLEMQHTEHMQALEHGHALPPVDERSNAAGRTAALVPMVVVCAAGTVTCFLVAYKSEHTLSVALAVWSVTGVIGLAAITGGVALMGRLAQLELRRGGGARPGAAGEVTPVSPLAPLGRGVGGEGLASLRGPAPHPNPLPSGEREPKVHPSPPYSGERGRGEGGEASEQTPILPPMENSSETLPLAAASIRSPATPDGVRG